MRFGTLTRLGTLDWTATLTKENSHATDHAKPLVRYTKRRGSGVLLLDLPELEDQEGHVLRRGRTPRPALC